MSWFKLSTKFFVFTIVYLMLIYTTVYAMQPERSKDDFAIGVPDVAMVDVNVTGEDYNASVDQGAAIVGGVVGFLVGAIGVALIATGVLAPVGLFIVAGGLAGALIGAEVGYQISYFNRDTMIEIGFGDIAVALKGLLGGIISVVGFILSIMTFGVSEAIMSGGLPESFFWIAWLMTVPIWLYYIVVLTGFVIEGAKAVKLW